MTLEGGPKLKHVTKRVTRDVDSGQIIDTVEDVRKAPNPGHLYLEIPGGPKNIETDLHYTKFNDEEPACPGTAETEGTEDRNSEHRYLHLETGNAGWTHSASLTSDDENIACSRIGLEAL